VSLELGRSSHLRKIQTNFLGVPGVESNAGIQIGKYVTGVAGRYMPIYILQELWTAYPPTVAWSISALPSTWWIRRSCDTV